MRCPPARAHPAPARAAAQVRPPEHHLGRGDQLALAGPAEHLQPVPRLVWVCPQVQALLRARCQLAAPQCRRGTHVREAQHGTQAGDAGLAAPFALMRRAPIVWPGPLVCGQLVDECSLREEELP
eukprot:3307855-Prorocentrum_lima.AAC.1